MVPGGCAAIQLSIEHFLCFSLENNNPNLFFETNAELFSLDVGITPTFIPGQPQNPQGFSGISSFGVV